MELSNPPPKKKDLGLNIQPERTIANCSQTVSPTLPPGEYKRLVGWGLVSRISSFATLLRPLIQTLDEDVLFILFRFKYEI